MLEGGIMNENSRMNNSIRNVSYGLIVTVLNTLVSFITRTALVKILGTEILGLNGLFTEIISMLSLAELGVGMAIIYSLYKPISNNDQKKISQLMSLYRSAYNIIGFVTIVLGCLLMPYIHNLITEVDYPLSYIRIIFILFVIKTASTYFFSYKTSLLNADQKQYIVSVITAIIKLVVTVFVVIGLIIFKNYILYLIILIIQSLVTNIVLSKYVDEKYPFIDYRDKLSKEEKKEVFFNIKNIFIKRVSGVITSSTDNILISILVSTIQVGFYSNYIMLFSLVRTLKQQFTNGIAASIGNLSVEAEAEHCIVVLKRLTYLYFLFAMTMSAGMMAVSKSFISIWLGTEYVMADSIIYVAIFNLFLEICCDPLWQYLEVSGLFKQDKNIAILGSGVNLVVSIILGMKIGIIGIFIGTVCTQLIQLIMKTRLLFGNRFSRSPLSYYFLWIKMIIGYIIMTAILFFIINKIVFTNSFIEFGCKGIIAVGVSWIITIILFMKSDECCYSKQFIADFCEKIIKHR